MFFYIYGPDLTPRSIRITQARFQDGSGCVRTINSKLCPKSTRHVFSLH